MKHLITVSDYSHFFRTPRAVVIWWRKIWKMIHESRNDETHCIKNPCYLNKGAAVLLKETSEFRSKIKASPLKTTCFWTKIQQTTLVTLTGFSMDLLFFKIKTDSLVKASGMWSLCLIKIIIHLKVSYKSLTVLSLQSTAYAFRPSGLQQTCVSYCPITHKHILKGTWERKS